MSQRLENQAHEFLPTNENRGAVRRWLTKNWGGINFSQDTIDRIITESSRTASGIREALEGDGIIIKKEKLKRFERQLVPDLVASIGRATAEAAQRISGTELQENEWLKKFLCPALETKGRGNLISPTEIPDPLKNIFERWNVKTISDFLHMLVEVNTGFSHQRGHAVTFETAGLNSDNQERLWEGNVMLHTLKAAGSCKLGEETVYIDMLEPKERLERLAAYESATGTIRIYRQDATIKSILPRIAKILKESTLLANTETRAYQNILLCRMFEKLLEEHQTSAGVCEAFARMSLSHELRHLQNVFDTFGKGRVPTPELRHEAANTLLAQSDHSALRSLFDRPVVGLSSQALEKHHIFHDSAIDEITAYMTQMIENPRCTLLQIAKDLCDPPKNERALIYTVAYRCIIALLAQEMKMCDQTALEEAWHLNFREENRITTDFPRWYIHMANELALHEPNILRLITKRVYTNEFAGKIDSPPFAKINDEGSLEYRLQVGDALLKA